MHASQLIQSIDKRIENGFLAIRDEATQKRVLGSLKYDGMNDRRNTIKKHHRKTFEWIFRGQVPLPNSEDDYSSDFESDSASENSVAYSDISESESTSLNGNNGMVDEAALSDTSEDDAPLPWDDFVAWLQSNDPVYWVSGKPGSGKSTLMLFLLQDTRTQALLDKWRSGTRIISHFLLSSGHLLQRNVKGIYLSLLHQILEEDIQDNGFSLSILAQKIPRVLSKDNAGDWADVELKTALKVILKTSTKPTCIFVDGLDELVPSEIDDDLWSFLRSLQSISQLKICLSSRPEPTFQIRLENVPKLRIHTLTESDIRTYATDFLRSTILPSRNNPTAWEREEFVRIICERSNGVFLWVYLVLKRLRKGLTNNDSISVLNDRLEQTPKELHDLFSDMWSRLGQDAELTDYMSTAATYFSLVATAQARRNWPLGVYKRGINVPDIMLATDRRYLQSIVDGCDIDPEQFEERCKRVLMNLETRCAGFLESHEIDLLVVPRKNCKLANQTRYHKLRVQFIHRSASEYLLSTREGNQVLAHDTSSARDRLALLCHVDIAIARLWGFCLPDDDADFEPISCLTIDGFLTTLSTYADEDNSQSISTGFWLSLLSLGGLIYTDARYRNEDYNRDFFSIHAGSEVLGLIGNKSPDFIMIVCGHVYESAMDLLPTYHKLFGSRLTSDYLGYLSLLICRGFVSSTSKCSGYECREGPLGRLISGLQSFVEYGANLNFEGPRSLYLRRMNFSEYCLLETPVSVLILNLYHYHGNICLLCTLRMISMLLKSGAEMNQTMIFSGTMYLSLQPYYFSSALVWDIPSAGQSGSNDAQLSIIFTTTPGYLLRLALSSFPQNQSFESWPTTLDSVVTDLMNHEALSSNLVAPDPLAFTGRAPFSAKFWGNRNIKSDTHKRLVQPLLINFLESLPGASHYSGDRKIMDQLWEVAHQCETTTWDEICGLATEYNVIRASEYMSQVPQLGEENERILRDHLRKEAYNHRGE